MLRRLRPVSFGLALGIACVFIPAGLARGGDVSFQNDVMAVLSKAGCNMGTCHGNQNGKGGFKLSLRGQDPGLDYRAMTRDLSGRRANRTQPERSLLLLKPLMELPHEGGQRFSRDAPEAAILRDWIAAGLPKDPPATPHLVGLEVTPPSALRTVSAGPIALQVTALFSNAERRDVTRLAVYETAAPIVEVSLDGVITAAGPGETTVIVRYLQSQVPVRVMFVAERPDYVWSGPPAANFIDEQVFAKLQALRIQPAPLCEDHVFLRRASLDLLGQLPTREEAEQFTADSDPDKRRRLVDTLLERPEFADAWALKWCDLLRVEEQTLDFKGVQNFHAWIRASVADNKPLDQFARELIAARGSTYSNPPANYYRAMREPLMRAESTAQVFLGVRLQCARCHNHPFDQWTQDDYYSWANLFARVDYKILENQRRDSNDSHEFDGEQIVFMAHKGEVPDPRTDKPLPPRFLGAVKPVAKNQDRLLALADWLVDPQNKRFTQTLANRTWFHLLGRGLVDPIDDFRATNPATHPELLDQLAAELVSHRFDQKHLIRTIMNSRTYQISGARNETNTDDEINYSRALVRRLTAEQLADGYSHVLEIPLPFSGYPLGMRAGEIPGVAAIRDRKHVPQLGDQWLKLFGRPPRLQSCECERTNEPTLSQTFTITSGPGVADLLRDPANRLQTLRGAPAAEQVRALYWWTISRPPTDEEATKAVEFLESADDRRIGLEDLAWALLNSNEFLLRR